MHSEKLDTPIPSLICRQRHQLHPSAACMSMLCIINYTQVSTAFIYNIARVLLGSEANALYVYIYYSYNYTSLKLMFLQLPQLALELLGYF